MRKISLQRNVKDQQRKNNYKMLSFGFVAFRNAKKILSYC